MVDTNALNKKDGTMVERRWGKAERGRGRKHEEFNAALIG
jgi:hypothetical protein